MIKVEKLNPFGRMCISLGMIPSTYKESLSYEEQLLWFFRYLEETLIPTVNNNGTAVEELQALYLEIKEFVDNYFENLDVQEEINNKLDDMADSGELAEIIGQYVQLAAVLSYDTLSDLLNAENIYNGSICKTLGYYNINDGGGAYYKIRTVTNEDTVDGIFIIGINDSETLIAELIVDDPLNVLTLGVKNDGTEDISTIINVATQNHNLYFPNGKYLVENDINVVYSILGDTYARGGVNNSSKGTLFISNITCNYNNRETKTVFDISNGVHGLNINKISIKLNDYECGIKGTGISSNNLYLDEISISNIKSTGIYLQGSKTKIPELSNIFLVGTGDSFEDSTGLNVNFSDYKVYNLDVMACRKGCKFGGMVQGNNFHIWCGSIQDGDGTLNHTEDESWFKGTVGLELNHCILDNIYLDTIYTKIKSNTTNNPNSKLITNLVCMDDSSMNSVTSMTGKNFDVGCQVNNCVTYITEVNKTNAFSDDVNYKNSSVILNITESDYLSQNKVGGSKYYDVKYKFIKNITGTSNNIIEIAKIKVENNCGGIVNLDVLHVKNRPHKIQLKFSNGSFTSGSLDNNGATDEKVYITTTKDADNIYKVYLQVNNNAEEYLTVSADMTYKWSGINVIDLGYRTSANASFSPDATSSTTGLTEITN